MLSTPEIAQLGHASIESIKRYDAARIGAIPLVTPEQSRAIPLETFDPIHKKLEDRANVFSHMAMKIADSPKSYKWQSEGPKDGKPGGLEITGKIDGHDATLRIRPGIFSKDVQQSLYNGGHMGPLSLFVGDRDKIEHNFDLEIAWDAKTRERMIVQLPLDQPGDDMTFNKRHLEWFSSATKSDGVTNSIAIKENNSPSAHMGALEVALTQTTKDGNKETENTLSFKQDPQTPFVWKSKMSVRGDPTYKDDGEVEMRYSWETGWGEFRRGPNTTSDVLKDQIPVGKYAFAVPDLAAMHQLVNEVIPPGEKVQPKETFDEKLRNLANRVFTVPEGVDFSDESELLDVLPAQRDAIVDYLRALHYVEQTVKAHPKIVSGELVATENSIIDPSPNTQKPPVPIHTATEYIRRLSQEPMDSELATLIKKVYGGQKLAQEMLEGTDRTIRNLFDIGIPVDLNEVRRLAQTPDLLQPSITRLLSDEEMAKPMEFGTPTTDLRKHANYALPGVTRNLSDTEELPKAGTPTVKLPGK